jgi:hypothetical protein
MGIEEQQRQLQPHQPPQQEQPAALEILPSAIEQLDKVLTNMCKFERMIEDHQESNIEQLSGLHMMSTDTLSHCPRILDQLNQYFEFRLHWDEELSAEYSNVFNEYINLRTVIRGLWNVEIQTKSDISDRETLGEKYSRKLDKLVQFQRALREIRIWSRQYATRLSLLICETVLANVDVHQYLKENDLVLIRKAKRRDEQTLEMLLQQQQEHAENDTKHEHAENDTNLASCTTCLPKETKYFQSSTGQTLMNTKTIENGQVKTSAMAVFGEDDAWTMEDKVCSICLIDFRPNDKVLRNATKLAAKTCIHIFHAECINKWVQELPQRSTCPCCRSPFLIYD